MQRMQSTRGGAFLASLGAGLEYYDFVAYALLAPYLRQAFFPSTSANLSTLEALGLFSVGYVARPLGGFVFGSMGDRFGRKNTFLITTLLMAAATFAMGCLPTHGQVGAWAPAILIFLRCVQGFSFGGELPGAITFVSKVQKKRATTAARR
jgi:MFS family permease